MIITVQKTMRSDLPSQCHTLTANLMRGCLRLPCRGQCTRQHGQGCPGLDG